MKERGKRSEFELRLRRVVKRARSVAGRKVGVRVGWDCFAMLCGLYCRTSTRTLFAPFDRAPSFLLRRCLGFAYCGTVVMECNDTKSVYVAIVRSSFGLLHHLLGALHHPLAAFSSSFKLGRQA